MDERGQTFIEWALISGVLIIVFVVVLITVKPF